MSDSSYVTYEQHLANIESGEDVLLPTGIFLRYAMEKHGVSQESLAQKLGISLQELGSSLHGNHVQGVHTGAKLAALTGKPVNFWREPNTAASEADSLTFDMDRDVSEVRAIYQGRPGIGRSSGEKPGATSPDAVAASKPTGSLGVAG